MATVDVRETTEGGADGAAAPEEAAGEELRETPDRKHVDALLDISEEELLPQEEYYCYGGWDEAVRGWARAAPLSCIFVTQKDKKPKSVDLPFPNAEDPAPDQLNQHVRSWCHAGPLQSEASHCPVGAAQKSPHQGLQRPNTKDLRVAPVELRPTKLQKPSHTSNTVVPIRQFPFLPPIVSLQLRPRMPGGGAKAPGGKSAEERGWILFQKSRTRGSRVGSGQSSPHLLSTIGPSAQNSYGMAGASQCNAATCSRLSSGKVIHLGGAAPRIPAVNPSKAVCAVNL